MNTKTRLSILTLTTFVLIILSVYAVSRVDGFSQTAAIRLFAPVLAQSDDSNEPPLLLLREDQTEYMLGKNMEILEDPTGNLTIQYVSSSDYSDQFVPSQVEAPNFGYTDSAYWVRFRLRNDSRLTDHWLLEVGFPNMHYVDLYLPEGETYASRQTGVLRPFDTRDIAYHRIVFNLPLPPEEERTFYMRFQNGASMTLPLTLWFPEAFIQASGRELLILGMFYGIFLIMLVYNIFLLNSLRDISYLYFICFLASGFLLFASYDAFTDQYLWPHQYVWNRYSVPLFSVPFMASILMFSDKFLEARTRNPKIHQMIMVMLVGWGITLLLVPFLSYYYLITWIAPYLVASLALAGAAGLISLQGGYKPARYFLLSWVGWIFGGILAILVRLTLIPSTPFTEHFFRLGLVWLMAFWAIGLADRVNLLKAEREKANLELQASETHYRQLVETMNDGLGVIDEDGRFTYVNKRLAEMLGYPPNDILEKSVTNFTDEVNHQILIDQLAQRKAGVSTSYELTWLRKDGSELVTVISPVPLFGHGRRYQGAFAVITDITERALAGRLLEQRVAERTRELSTLLEVARDITSTRELEYILNIILDRLKSVVDIHGSVIFTEQDSRWKILAWHWPSPLAESIQLELSLSEVQELSKEFELRGSIIHNSSISLEEPGNGFRKLINRLSSLSGPKTARWLGVPLLEKGSLIGILLLVSEEADAFSEDQIKITVAFANQIAIAIENNRLYQQVRESAVIEERNRLARDLHDSVTQMLFSASLVAELLPQRLHKDPELALKSAAQLRRLTRGALAEMRTMLIELRPETITKTPLGELLTRLTEAITSLTELPFLLYIDNLPYLPADVQTTYYRIAQEALNNVVKHAGAKQVIVSLGATPPISSSSFDDWSGEIKLVVKDDGIGYTPGNQNMEHMGLGIMRERATAINATLDFESQPGHGTAVTLVWHNQKGGLDDGKTIYSRVDRR